MRVLLTGATGFLGAQALRALLRAKAEVVVLRRVNSPDWRIKNLPVAGVVRGDLREIRAAGKVIQEARPEAVVHCAWAGVGNKHRNNAGQIDDNVLPGVELARVCAEAGAKHFIGLGSQAEYGPLNRRITEEDATQPTTLYGAAKLGAMVLLERVCSDLGMRFAWLRVFSTYGPMEDADWMIPYLIRALLRGERPTLTSCEQRWDYLFGPDAGEAIAAVATAEREPGAKGVFNLGSGQVYTLRHIVELIRDMIDPGLPVDFGAVPYRPDQVMHLEADITRLRAATGWSPATSLEEGLRQTVGWHREQLRQGERAP